MWFGHVLIIHRQRQSTPGRVRRCRHNKAGNGWEKSHDILKRRLQASCLWSLGILAKFRYCQGWGNGGCPRDVFIRIPLASIYGFLCLIICSKGLLYSYRRGLQRCSFYNIGQCEKPLKVGRATEQVPTLFFMPSDQKFNRFYRGTRLARGTAEKNGCHTD